MSSSMRSPLGGLLGAFFGAIVRVATDVVQRSRELQARRVVDPIHDDGAWFIAEEQSSMPGSIGGEECDMDNFELYLFQLRVASTRLASDISRSERELRRLSIEQAEISHRLDEAYERLDQKLDSDQSGFGFESEQPESRARRGDLFFGDELSDEDPGTDPQGPEGGMGGLGGMLN